jgi:putative sterol carrier protein
MAEVFTQEWADEVRAAVNSFPDPEYKATKLDMFWDWITVARQGFNGSFALGVRELNKFVKLTIDSGECTKAEIVNSADDATYVLNGDLATWRDIIDNGYDCGKAVMYRRFRLEQGDVFRFFNRIYFFTESLVALSKVPATIPA